MLTKCLICAGQKVMHIQAEKMTVMDSSLDFEKRGELRIEVKVEYAAYGQLRQIQDSSCLLRSRHFPSELRCDPDNTFDEFCVILGENTS